MNSVAEPRLWGAGTDVRALMAARALRTHFQPIARLRDGAIVAHEALVRTEPGCALRNPDELFAAARAQDAVIELEIECLRLAMAAWSRSSAGGQLFVNLSATALTTVLAQRDLDALMTLAGRSGLAGSGLVLELTEHERVRDVDALAAAAGRLRRHKVSLALDDFGDGRSSLRLWSEIKPEIVKIDRYFVHELSAHPEKLQTLRALMQISQTLGATLVAEGIETTEELHLVRDLGIALGQGWVLGRPEAAPVESILPAARAVIDSRDLAVFPERRRSTQQRATARTLLLEVPPVSPELTNQELFELFNRNERLAAVAIVDANQRPVGLVGRQRFVDRYAKPYFKELYGRQPCTVYANPAPRILELNSSMDELTEVLTSEDQRYLDEGVIIIEAGRYRGLGQGQDLVRMVTESRIEAARHANPLTLLPGNIPLTQHIQRLLDARREFAACYADLNQFKPFNDAYGYWRGDEMILLAARCLQAKVDPRRDFVGHVGGDDFVVLFQSDDWESRCEQIIEQFDTQARTLYDEQARSEGGLMAEDRHGVMRFHPLTTISLGVVRLAPHSTLRAEDVANAAAAAKRQAKLAKHGLYVMQAAAAGLPAAPTHSGG